MHKKKICITGNDEHLTTFKLLSFNKTTTNNMTKIEK